MLRLAELGLFLAPFALYVAWRFLAAKASPWLVAVAVGFAAVSAAATIWYGFEHSAPPNGRYVPAHMEDGRIVPGEVIPKPPR